MALVRIAFPMDRYHKIAEGKSAYTRPARNSNVSPFLGTAKAPLMRLIAMLKGGTYRRRPSRSSAGNKGSKLCMTERPCGPLRGMSTRTALGSRGTTRSGKREAQRRMTGDAIDSLLQLRGSRGNRKEMGVESRGGGEERWWTMEGQGENKRASGPKSCPQGGSLNLPGLRPAPKQPPSNGLPEHRRLSTSSLQLLLYFFGHSAIPNIDLWQVNSFRQCYS